jgi:hypothetical protein
VHTVEHEGGEVDFNDAPERAWDRLGPPLMSAGVRSPRASDADGDADAERRADPESESGGAAVRVSTVFGDNPEKPDRLVKPYVRLRRIFEDDQFTAMHLAAPDNAG